MSDSRIYLSPGTKLQLESGNTYEIIGEPIGSGGGSIIYPAELIRECNGEFIRENLLYALKECYPKSSLFFRNENKEIIAVENTPTNQYRLSHIKQMQLNEKQITQEIYRHGFRLVPILESSNCVTIYDNPSNKFQTNNTITVMESLSSKGRSLFSYVEEYERLSPLQTFHIIQQLLYAIQEVHDSNYLHLDIQNHNVFVKGSIEDNSNIITLIDFGCSRKMQNGKTLPISDKNLFRTEGFSAPEKLYKNDGTLQLTPETDIYSVGCLIMYLLTGKLFSTENLIHKSTKSYLSANDLRRIKCPKHLIPRMEEIISHSLKPDISERYHSANEMLEDVSDFLQALQPYRANLIGVTFDAFISYKHGDIDSKVATALQKRIETFRAPSGITKQRRPFKRVFVDEGELQCCPDYKNEIETALKNSGWLIVVCSSRTPSSEWVNKEIKYFLETHDSSRVLAILTEGNPETSFPDALKNLNTHETLFYADIRGDHLQQILKRIKSDEFFKLAAPMLGTTLSTLTQRHRNYLIRRIFGLASIAITILFIFTLQTLYQKKQIDRQYQQARQNQARYLADISLDLYQKGDKRKSLLTNLAIQPENSSEEAVVPEQLYAFNTTLNSYKSGKVVDYSPSYMAEADNITFGTLSTDNNYYFAINESGTLFTLSGNDGELIWKMNISEIEKKIENLNFFLSQESFQEINKIFPIDENTIAIGLEHSIVVLDINSQEITKAFSLNTSISTTTIYDFNQKIIALAPSYGSELFVYNLNTGKEILHLNLDVNDSSNNFPVDYTINDIAIDPESSSIALALSYQFLSEENHTSSDNEYANGSTYLSSDKSASGLIIYNLNNNSVDIISDIPAKQVLFVANNKLAAIHATQSISETYAQSNWGNESFSYHQSLYRLDTKELIHATTPLTFLDTGDICGLFSEQLEIDGEQFHGVISWLRGNLIVLNADTGEICTSNLYRANIIGISVYDKTRLLIAFDDGSVHLSSIDKTIVQFKVLNLDLKTRNFIYNPKDYNLILNYNLFCSPSRDPNMKHWNWGNHISSEIRLDTVEYVETEQQTFRILYFRKESFYERSGIIISPTTSEQVLYYYECDEPTTRIQNVGLAYHNDALYLTFTEASSDDTTRFKKINVTTGITLIDEDVTKYDTLHFDYSSDILYTKDVTTMFVKRDSGIVKFDISSNHLIPDSRSILSRMRIGDFALTGDGKYLVLLTENSNTFKQIYIYCLESDTYEEFKMEVPISFEYVSNQVVAGKSSSRIAIYDKLQGLYIIDCDSLTLISKIDVTIEDDYHFDFFDNDHFLILSNGNCVHLYDIDSSHNICTYTGDSALFGYKIITDSSNQYFALKDTSVSENLSYDSGLNTQILQIFYVDENHQFYPYASVDYGNICFSGNEVCSSYSNNFSYSYLYSYTELKSKALKSLNGQTLTQEEKQEFFISE